MEDIVLWIIGQQLYSIFLENALRKMNVNVIYRWMYLCDIEEMRLSDET